MKAIIRNTILIQITFFFFNSNCIKAQNDNIANLPQYLFPEFSRSVVVLKTGKTLEARMNYNTITEKMTFFQAGKVMDLTKPETIDTILIKSSRFVFLIDRFCEVLVIAPISLFVQHKSDFSSEGRPAAYGTTSQTVGPTSISKFYSNNNKTYNLKLPENSRVTSSPIYWIRIENGLHSFTNARQFIKLFPSKESEIKQFITQYNITFNNPEDLIKVVKHCNTLYR